MIRRSARGGSGTRFVGAREGAGVLAVALALSGPPARAKDATVSLRIVSPAEGTYLSGPVTLKVLTDPPAGSSRT